MTRSVPGQCRKDVSVRLSVLAEFEERSFKRWYAEDRALLFALKPGAASYDVVDFGFSAGVLAVPQLHQHGPRARFMPLSLISPDGTLTVKEPVLLPPLVCVSPNRNRMCWVGADGRWVIFAPERSEIFWHQRDVNDRLSEAAFWLPGQESWAEPVYSNSFHSFSFLNYHSLNDHSFVSKRIRNLNKGTCVGTTSDGLGVVINMVQADGGKPPLWNHSAIIQTFELVANELKPYRRKVDLPGGCVFTSVCLAPQKRLLGWILNWNNESGIRQGIWLTTLTGCAVGPVYDVTETEFVDRSIGRELGDNRCFDLEWSPDEKTLSLVSGNRWLHVVDVPV